MLIGVGRSDYEALQPRLRVLLAAQEQDMKLAASLEKRIATLVERHATHVSCFLRHWQILACRFSFASVIPGRHAFGAFRRLGRRPQ